MTEKEQTIVDAVQLIYGLRDSTQAAINKQQGQLNALHKYVNEEMQLFKDELIKRLDAMAAEIRRRHR